MSFLSRLFAKPQPASKDIAKERLRVVLIHDRTDVSPELLQTLKQEILAVISQHVIIDDEEGIAFTVSQTRGHSRLEVNIPLLGMRRPPLGSTRQSAARPKR
jgi:cell division topological specificity factor